MVAGFEASSADRGVTGLGDREQIKMAYTHTCLADESCTREVFFDMALGNRFVLEDYHASQVVKLAGPVALQIEFDNDALREVAEQVVEGIVHATKNAGLPLIDEAAATAFVAQDTEHRRIYIVE